MFVVTHVLVAVAGRNTGLTHDDHARRATIDTKTTSGAHVFVDNKNHMVVGVGTGRHNIG